MKQGKVEGPVVLLRNVRLVYDPSPYHAAMGTQGALLGGVSEGAHRSEFEVAKKVSGQVHPGATAVETRER